MNLTEKMKEVQEIGERIKEKGKEYDLLMDRMYQVIQTLEQHWTGNQQDYLVFMNRVSKEEKNMKMVGKIIQEYGQVVEDISINTTTLSDSIKAIVGRV